MMRFRRSADRYRRPERHQRRLALEPLEGRQLLSLGSEFAGTINTTTRNAQFGADNATRADGSSVVVWTDTFSATDHDIRAQRINSLGAKVGPEILVSGSSLDEGSPAVAMNGQGQFVVAWTQKTSNGDSNVVAREYDPNGNPVGGIVPVGVGTFQETDPDVAIDAVGNFAVAYTRNTNGNNPDIFAKRYNHADQLLGVINVATTGRAETHAKIAMTPDGRFDVAWEEAFSTTDHDIKMNRYSASGALQGTNFIASSTAYEQTPSVAMDHFGNAVVAWERAGDIMARRVSSTGVAGPQLTIASSPNFEFGPSVAMRQGGGSFVVSYESLTPTSARAKVAEVSTSNQVTTFDAGDRSGGSVSIDAFDHYLVTYTSPNLDIVGRHGFLHS